MNKVLYHNFDNEMNIHRSLHANAHGNNCKAQSNLKYKETDSYEMFTSNYVRINNKDNEIIKRSTKVTRSTDNLNKNLFKHLGNQNSKKNQIQEVEPDNLSSQKLLQKRNYKNFKTDATNKVKTQNLTCKSNKTNMNQESSKIHQIHLKKTKNYNYFQNIEIYELIEKIENTIEETNTHDEFNNCDGFIFKIKQKFGHFLNDKNMVRNFNLINLKVVWAQFLLNKTISRSHLKQMSSFEKIIFLTYLRRFGYIQNVDKYINLKNINELEKLNNSNQKSEKQLLAFALKLIFKKIIYSYFNKDSKRPFEKDNRPIRISKQEKVKMTHDYFSENLKTNKSIEDFIINEEILTKTSSMLEFIKKMASSQKMCDFIDKHLESKLELNSNISGKINCNTGNSKSTVQTFYLRQQTEILNNINQRITNFEIILNQFSPIMEKEKIFKWMGIIIKDFKLNSKLNVCWGFDEINEAFQLFLKYFNQFRTK